MTNEMIHNCCILNEDAEKLIEAVFRQNNLSARAYSRLLKVSRTIADLDASDKIRPEHVAESLQYRSVINKYWGE